MFSSVRLSILRFVVLAVILMMFLAVAVTLIVSALVFLALACAVGIPLWLIAKPHLRRHGIDGTGIRPIDRVKELYVEGKIDLFELERRVAHLLSFES